jgi:hypothetical protein
MIINRPGTIWPKRFEEEMEKEKKLGECPVWNICILLVGLAHNRWRRQTKIQNKAGPLRCSIRSTQVSTNTTPCHPLLVLAAHA